MNNSSGSLNPSFDFTRQDSFIPSSLAARIPASPWVNAIILSRPIDLNDSAISQ
jgi:hypothetical protein